MGRLHSDAGASHDSRGERGEGLAPAGSPDDRTPPDPDQDIRELVEVRKLDAALRLLMRRHGDAIYRFCRESLRDAALADDVQQRVFIEAHRDLRRFGGWSTMRSWLFGIARHRILDAAKSRRRQEGPLERGARADIADGRPAADERIDDARLNEALRICLEGVGEHVRTALLLRFQQGLTFEEMAELSGEKPGTLQARVSRALPVLRECIEKKGRGVL